MSPFCIIRFRFALCDRRRRAVTIYIHAYTLLHQCFKYIVTEILNLAGIEVIHLSIISVKSNIDIHSGVSGSWYANKCMHRSLIPPKNSNAIAKCQSSSLSSTAT